MDITRETALLGGMSAQTFMRRHWQKKPLLVRQAVPGGVALLSRARLFELAGSDEVEARLVVRERGRWSLRHGPLKRAAIPLLKRPHWTLLVQGLDLHLPAARALLERFRFVPDARLDDLMLSYATDGGGVGPHLDSYDVFLLQAQGRRRWRIGRIAHPRLVPDVPLKILANFEAEHEWLLEAGDMLYLPPGWAHDGVAEGECLTASIGFRASGRDEIGREVLQRMLDGAEAAQLGALYRDPRQGATGEPGRIPVALQAFAADAVARWLADPAAIACALGEVLSEPKRGVWFEAPEPAPAGSPGAVTLDQRTRMLYDLRHVFINGESFRGAGRDAKLMRRLADRRRLEAREVEALSREASELLREWLAAGWLRAVDATQDGGAP
ncbi:MAG: cupin domain-containing protein [Burkholderiales bacterium]|nr:cupin domain-containing protein [Burkholderiales bacterium]MDE2300584.1 cupin domain-containing protein [Burkholderiales bacterium]MDE2626633.1 cupin domain-containing protein [Burkholderiales bacterium]